MLKDDCYCRLYYEKRPIMERRFFLRGTSNDRRIYQVRMGQLTVIDLVQELVANSLISFTIVQNFFTTIKMERSQPSDMRSHSFEKCSISPCAFRHRGGATRPFPWRRTNRITFHRIRTSILKEILYIRRYEPASEDHEPGGIK